MSGWMPYDNDFGTRRHEIPSRLASKPEVNGPSGEVVSVYQTMVIDTLLGLCQ